MLGPSPRVGATSPSRARSAASSPSSSRRCATAPERIAFRESDRSRCFSVQPGGGALGTSCGALCPERGEGQQAPRLDPRPEPAEAPSSFGPTLAGVLVGAGRVVSEDAADLVCVECGREPRDDETAGDEWRAYPTSTTTCRCSVPSAPSASSATTPSSSRSEESRWPLRTRRGAGLRPRRVASPTSEAVGARPFRVFSAMSRQALLFRPPPCSGGLGPPAVPAPAGGAGSEPGVTPSTVPR